MEYKEYMKIRGEAEGYAKQILQNAPDDFTMLHLELLKTVVPTEIDGLLSELKRKTRLNQTRPLQYSYSAAATACTDRIGGAGRKVNRKGEEATCTKQSRRSTDTRSEE